MRWAPTSSPSAPEANQLFISKPSMNRFLKDAGAGLDIRLNTQVVSLSDHEEGWLIGTDDHSDFETWDLVVVTAPAPQAVGLLSFSARLRSDLGAIHMAPCWTLLLAFSPPAHASMDVIEPGTEELTWIGRNSSKPGRDNPFDTWVAHASAKWSRGHIESTPESVLSLLKRQVLDEIGQSDTSTVFASAHRWRYATVEKALGVPFLSDETGRVFFAGDGCLGPNVESAFESGVRLARHVAGLVGK